MYKTKNQQSKEPPKTRKFKTKNDASTSSTTKPTRKREKDPKKTIEDSLLSSSWPCWLRRGRLNERGKARRQSVRRVVAEERGKRWGGRGWEEELTAGKKEEAGLGSVESDGSGVHGGESGLKNTREERSKKVSESESSERKTRKSEQEKIWTNDETEVSSGGVASGGLSELSNSKHEEGKVQDPEGNSELEGSLESSVRRGNEQRIEEGQFGVEEVEERERGKTYPMAILRESDEKKLVSMVL